MTTKNVNYLYFLFEAIKITVYCLLITAAFKLAGASNNTLLIIFNMAVMSSAATFSPERKQGNFLLLGSGMVVFSIITGGLFGYYLPLLSKLFTIGYAGLAFLLPKSKEKTNIFVTGALMFLIFCSLPFDWHQGLNYTIDGLFVLLTFVIFNLVFDSTIHKNIKFVVSTTAENRKINTIIAIIALSSSWMVAYYLLLHTTFSHLYWIGLTVLLVIQGSQQKTIQISLLRILINIVGALIAVIVFNYIIPPIFLINFIVLIVFLFLIFMLGFSYIGRTLFIELFVLGFTHMLVNYQNIIALDRIILTCIGGLIVIFATLISYGITKIYYEKFS